LKQIKEKYKPKLEMTDDKDSLPDFVDFGLKENGLPEGVL
jgi:hypothetical protein